jgi:MFS family permease
MPAFNAIIADSIPPSERGAGFGAFRMFTSLPMALSPVIGGIIMDSLGYKEGLKIFLVVSFFATIVVTFVRWKAISETLSPKSSLASVPQKEEKHGIGSTLSNTFNLPRTIWIMMIVAVMGSFGMRMVWEFLPIYAVEVVGLSNTQLGIVETTVGLIATFLALPGGMLSDQFGRKPMILVSRVLKPFTMLGITLSKNYLVFFMVRSISSVADAFGGGAGIYAGGPAWNALIADLVPETKRGTVMGTIGTLTGIIGTPSSLIGAYLWQIYNPHLPFQLSMVLGLIGATIFALWVKEPK